MADLNKMSFKSVDVPPFENLISDGSLYTFQYGTCVILFGHSFNLFDFVSVSVKTSHLAYLHGLIALYSVGVLKGI